MSQLQAGTSALVRSLLCATLLWLMAPGGLRAQDAGTGEGWTFIVAPYLVFPHMDGSLTVRGIPVEVDVGPEEIFDSLDFGAMLYLEMANGDWAITLDGLYMNLGERGQTPLTGREAEADTKQLAIEATGMRRVASWAEIGIGGRLNSLDGGLSVAPGDVALPGIDVSETKTWFDPVIAARLTAPLGGRWRLGVRGDIGGFGLGSEFAWQVFPFVGYRFGSLFELEAGYRALGMEYETGSGDDLFVYDITTFGPQLGLVFHF
jgi:hypothetical protein